MPSSWKSPERLLLGPGPSTIDPRVLRAMAQQSIGPLDPQLMPLLDRISESLRGLFGTRNPTTFPLSATGMAGMETLLLNLVEPGDRVVVGVCGYFGERFAELAARAGGEVTRVEAEWGQALGPAAMSEAIRRVEPAVVALVHAETSTGVLQPLEEIAAAARGVGALTVIDAVTSLGGAPVRLDEWGIDAAYSGTQKCIGCPPGLSPLSVGERALEKLRRRSSRMPSFYFDLSLIARYWSEERFYHHTVPCNMLYGLAEALAIIEEEGLEARWERHRRNAGALRAGLAAMGLELFADERTWLPSVTTVRVPEGTDEAAVRRLLLEEWNMEIGGGLGRARGRIWRIGLMGYSSTPANVFTVLDALRAAVARQGVALPDGLAAAAEALRHAG